MTRDQVMDWLLERVRAEGHCLIWTLTVNSSGLPVATVDGVTSRSVRRWLHEQLVGPIDTGMKLVPSCRNSRCLAMRHSAYLLHAQIMDLAAIEGRLSTPQARTAKLKANRARSSSTQAVVPMVRAMRALGHSLDEISAATGLSMSMASKIGTGKAWADHVPAASVFTWNGAI